MLSHSLRVADARGVTPTHLLIFVLVLVVLGVGLFARFYGVGERPLAIDEYYTVRSIELILERGLPEYPTGGYYLRGPVYQYLAAASALLFGADRFGFELPSAIFSLISIGLAYLYGRRFLAWPVAAALAAALLVSSWHIEMAHFIRMYAAFQCTALLFLIALDEAYFRGRYALRYAPHGALLLSVMTHSLGVLLAPFLFLPLLLGGRGLRFPSAAHRLRFAGVSIGTVFLALILARLDFRNWGVVDPLPPEYEPVVNLPSTFFVPAFPFWSLHPDPLMNLVLLVVVAAAGAGLLLLLRRRFPAIRATDVLLLVLLVAVVAHLFTVAALVLLALLARYRIDRVREHPRRTYFLLALAAGIGLAWLVLALAAPARLFVPEVTGRWELAGHGLGDQLKALWTTFFGWPDLYANVARPFVLDLPVIGLLLLLSLIYVALTAWHASWFELLRHPACIIVYTIVCFSLLRANSSSRYWFHLYPVLLCLIAVALSDGMRRLSERRWPRRAAAPETAAAAVFLVAFALSSDFSPSHIAHLAEPKVAFRMAEFEPYARIWYPRSDFSAASDYVDTHAARNEGVRVIVDSEPPLSYYLDREHAVYQPRDLKGGRFGLVSRVGGTVELWSSMHLLSTPEEVVAYTEGADTVWILRNTNSEFAGIDPEQVWGAAIDASSPVFTTLDGRIEVLRLQLAKPTGPATGG